MGDWAEEFERAQEVAEMGEWVDEEEKSPQNLPKADAYSLLAEVRADIQECLIMYKDYELTQTVIDWILKKYDDKVSEHFS